MYNLYIENKLCNCIVKYETISSIYCYYISHYIYKHHMCTNITGSLLAYIDRIIITVYMDINSFTCTHTCKYVHVHVYVYRLTLEVFLFLLVVRQVSLLLCLLQTMPHTTHFHPIHQHMLPKYTHVYIYRVKLYMYMYM